MVKMVNFMLFLTTITKFKKKSVDLAVWVYFLTLKSIALVYMSSLLPVPHSLDYSSFIVSFEIWKGETFDFVLFQDCFGYCGFFHFSYEFYDGHVNFCTKGSWNFDRLH